MTQAPKKEERGYFTQVPIILLDEYCERMTEASFIGFLRFYRHFNYKGVFAGSIRKLCKVLHMPRTTLCRAIDKWVECGLVEKGTRPKEDENRDEMVLFINGSKLWQENAAYSQCPNLGQSVPEISNSVPIWDNTQPNGDESVPNWGHYVPTSSSKMPPYITQIDQINTDKEDQVESASETAFDANASPPSPSLQVVDKPQTASQETQQYSYSHHQESEAIGDKQSKKQETLLEAPLSEPVMDGAWVAEKVVQYAEWRNQKRYTDKMRTGQLEAARFFHRDDPHMTLEQFKQAYDNWFPWWQEHNKGPLHVSDLKVKQKNGIVRLYAALERIEAEKKRAQFQIIKPDHQRAVSPNPGSALLSPEKQERNKQRLRERAAARAAAEQQGVAPSVQVAVN